MRRAPTTKDDDIETESEERESTDNKSCQYVFNISGLLWSNYSLYDTWISCMSNQVAHGLLTLPSSMSQMGMLAGIIFQIFCSLMTIWTAHIIRILYDEHNRIIELTNQDRRKGMEDQFLLSGDDDHSDSNMQDLDEDEEHCDELDLMNDHVSQWLNALKELLRQNWWNVAWYLNQAFVFMVPVIQLVASASNLYYTSDKFDKRIWTCIFCACCSVTLFIPSFNNHRVFSLLSLLMVIYTAFYLFIASIFHSQVQGGGVKNLKWLPEKSMDTLSSTILFLTGASNMLYTFGGHGVIVDISGTKRKSKVVNTYATLILLVLMLLPSMAVHVSFGNQLLMQANVIALMPRTMFRHVASSLMLAHQFITFGFLCMPLYLAREKTAHIDDYQGTWCRRIRRVKARLHVFVPMCYVAIMFPYLGTINSLVGSCLAGITVYVIPGLAFMYTFWWSATKRKVAGLWFVGELLSTYKLINMIVLTLLLLLVPVSVSASFANLFNRLCTFGIFTRCYQCTPPA